MESASSDLKIYLIRQMLDAIEKIEYRSQPYSTGNDYLLTPEGMTVLDSICMQFIALGETLKRFDRETEGTLLVNYPDIEWKKVMGLRDIVAHRYFDIDADQIQWIIDNQLQKLKTNINTILHDLLKE